MRSFQKKLTATAAAAALLAAIGTALAQNPPSTEDLNSATANTNQHVSQGTSVKNIPGSDMSTNGPLNSSSRQNLNTTAPTDSVVTPAPASTDNSSMSTNNSSTYSPAPAATDTSTNSTDSSMPAPRADRN